ncbi:geranylgeranyl transferase type-2 subunit alpha [Aricia agestis]|uniref:geranylgeranyl transferase type-2 subunit alpha n=1 Tax=Aricia agestis TaxID=91739 RepID=UPI001C206A04|nr:geranylgeranyl transferase type-2 subunit alpha [Aricia agestis]
MHGRVKVRTSEEEKARKERERQEKLKLFKHAMQKIFKNRKQGILDQEQLQLTEKVLIANPDIYTLWNIRRDIILHLSRSTDLNDEELTKLYDSELSLTEYCLKINPKSYCAWHQREWILITRPDPNWKKELELCEKYLKLDERNFHTWDYRRFVVSQCKPPLEQEFDFTTEKLHDNFSNYSAWHYRSKMLLQLHPDTEGGRPIQDSHHKHELKMVQSAAFTDPDDTSAWFYQRWLLGAVKTTLQPVVCTVTSDKVTVAWNNSVSRECLNSRTKLMFGDNIINGEWYSSTGYDNDDLWILKHNQDITSNLDMKLEFEDDNNQIQSLFCKEFNKSSYYVGKNNISFQSQYSDSVLEELKEQLDSCRQLLDLEPDNKWTLLTLTFFLHCIDATKYDQEVLNNLHKLIQQDSMRAGYYYDLLTKWSIEQQLTNDYKQSTLLFKVSCKDKITALPHLQYNSFCTIVDLSNQNLTSKVLASLTKLQNCKELDLSNNNLTTLKEFPSLQLQKLNLKGNAGLMKEEIQYFMENNKSVEILF